MNILKVLENIYYKAAYECGLQLTGIEEGRPQWIGSSVQFANYYKILESKNL